MRAMLVDSHGVWTIARECVEVAAEELPCKPSVRV